jgi:hypothetical protein
MVLQPFVGPWQLFQFLDPVRELTEGHKYRSTQYRHNALSGIRTHDPRVPANEDSSCLTPRGHCDRHLQPSTNSICIHTFQQLLWLSSFHETVDSWRQKHRIRPGVLIRITMKNSAMLRRALTEYYVSVCLAYFAKILLNSNVSSGSWLTGHTEIHCSKKLYFHIFWSNLIQDYTS